MSAIACLSLKAFKTICQVQEVPNFRGVCLRSTNRSCSIIAVLTTGNHIEANLVIVAIFATQRFTTLSTLRLLTLLSIQSHNRIAMGKNRQKQGALLPTPAELRLLEVLWRIGEGTIDDIVRASGENPPPNYKTVQTLLRIMERKQQVDHKQQGRAFLFRPVLGLGDLHRLSIRQIIAKYFTGSRTELLMELLSDERITRQELRQLESLIRNRRKEW